MVGVGVRVWRDGSVTWLVLVIVVADALQLGVTWFFWRNRVGKTGGLPAPGVTARQVVRMSRPFAVAGVLAILQMRVIVLLLDHYADAQQVGWYVAANRLVEAARLAPSALFVALFPQLAALAARPARFQRLFRTASGLVLGYSFFVSVVMLIGASFLVRLLFGPGFEESGNVLRLLIWSLVPGLWRALLTLHLYARQQEQVVTLLLALSLAIQIGAGMMLIPAYGLNGAAWTVVLGETVLAVTLFGATHLVEKVVEEATSC